MESEIARTGGAGGTNLLPLSRFHFLEGTRVKGIAVQFPITTTGNEPMHRVDDRKTYWTRTEAQNLVGKIVNTNAGTRVLVVSAFPANDGEYMVVDSDGYMYKKVCVNGLYCWA